MRLHVHFEFKSQDAGDDLFKKQAHFLKYVGETHQTLAKLSQVWKQHVNDEMRWKQSDWLASILS